MTSLLWAGICDISILIGLFLLGYLIVRLILGRVDKLTTLSLSFGLGCGLFTWLLFILSWSGVPLTKVTVLGSFIVLMIVLVLFSLRIPSHPAEETLIVKADSKIAAWTTRGLWIVILVMIAGVSFLAVGLSYFGWDDIARWTLEGYGIALRGTVLAAANLGAVGLSYPLNIPILISVFRILDGDLLPGSKLIYPVFYASLLIGCYRFWAVQGLKKWTATLGVLLLASTPIVFTHAFMGYANLPFTYYLISGLLWSIEGIQTGAVGKTLLGGFLLAIAVLTRPEGLAMLIAIVVVLGIVRFLTATGRMKILVLLLPVMILTVPWYVFQGLHPTSNVEVYQYSRLAVKGILTGDIRWPAFIIIIRYIAGQIIRFRDWGWTVLLLGLILVAGLRSSAIRHDLTRSVLFFSLIALSLVVFWTAYIAAYAPAGSAFLYEWISTTIMRSFMPSGLCLTLLGFLTFKEMQ